MNPPPAESPSRHARHGRLAKLLGLEVYFAHPYTAWERGTCENTNGLLRQYLPKWMSFSELTDSQLGSYVRALNKRPRNCLNYRTPAAVSFLLPSRCTYDVNSLPFPSADA